MFIQKSTQLLIDGWGKGYIRAMKIAVLGTGSVGETIASKLVEIGHEVMMGSRSSDNDKARAFVKKHEKNALNGSFSDAAVFGELVFNCTKGEITLIALQLAGEENLVGKILVDVSNPLDFSNGQPPSLIPALSNTNSLGEEIQKLLPGTHVVKTLNTMWAGLMVNPALAGGDHTNFLCGNSQEAKQKVRSLLLSFGWKDSNLLDLGDISSARGTEAVLPVWLRIWGARKNGVFGLHVVGAAQG